MRPQRYVNVARIRPIGTDTMTWRVLRRTRNRVRLRGVVLCRTRRTKRHSDVWATTWTVEGSGAAPLRVGVVVLISCR